MGPSHLGSLFIHADFQGCLKVGLEVAEIFVILFSKRCRVLCLFINYRFLVLYAISSSINSAKILANYLAKT